jgi:YggT family protein
MGNAFVEALILVVSKLGGLYIAAVMVRFLLQAARADFYNPFCQAIVKATSPLLNPLRRIIPSWRGFDIAALVLALLLNTVATAVMCMASGSGLALSTFVSWSFVGLIGLTLDIYFYAMMASIIASFVAPFNGHPLLLVIYQLLQPFYKLAHRILPPMGGLDLSPLLLMLAIKVIEILVSNPLAQGLRIVPGLVIGV